MKKAFLLYKQDMCRHRNKTSFYMRALMFSFRMTQSCKYKLFWKIIYRILADTHHLEIPVACSIGGGFYIGHCQCITINKGVSIGTNVNIHKGVTIGQENRGKRKGCPSIGNNVWIGVNSTIVGNITIGDDVLIAPNCYVNTDIPSHSVVFGNPCIIKHRNDATEGYINSKCIG